jgi:small-conductance mechanosensitive channel
MRLTFGRDADDLSLSSARTNLKAIIMASIWVAAALFFLANLGINITTFITGLGIGGVAIALAVQSVLGDVLSSFSISIDKPFEIGDFIVIDNLRGTVEQIGLKTTRIRSINGELLVFGNQDLTKARIQNFKRMQSRRILFRIGLVYGTNSAQLKAIPEIVKGIIEAQEQLQFDRCHFVELGSFSLNYEIVYTVSNPDFAIYCEHQQAINLALIEEFEKRGIEFAFPTQTILVDKNG